MGLLDKIKAQQQASANKTAPAAETATPAASTAAPATPTAPKSNPLLNKTGASTGKPNPLLGKTAKAETPVKETSEEKVVASPLAGIKKDPFGPENANAETKTEAPKKNLLTKKPAPVVESKPEETTAPAEEVKASEEKADVIADMKEADNAAAANTETAAKEENKKNTGKGSKKTTVKKQETASEPKEEMISIPTTSVSYTDAIEAIRSPFVDEDWEKFRTNIESSLAEIVIEDDMNPATMKSTIAQLSAIRQSIWGHYVDTKTLFDQLASEKPEGLIERIKKICLGDGSNDLQRKKAGVEACMYYTAPNGTAMNLYEVLDETRSRKNFLQETMNSIQYKTSILITMSGALKLEKDHTVAEV